jgi:hypothetical protein
MTAKGGEPYWYWLPDEPVELLQARTAISSLSEKEVAEALRVLGELLNAVSPPCSSPLAPPPKTASLGRPPKYPWAKVEAALTEECKLREGAPRRNHPDRDWRTQADAYRVAREALNLASGGPSDSALKANVRPMLKRIGAKGGN